MTNTFICRFRVGPTLLLRTYSLQNRSYNSTRHASITTQISLITEKPKPKSTKPKPKNISPQTTPRSITQTTSSLFSMAEAAQNFSTAADGGGEDEELKFGFKRSEMYQSNLAGTVDPYDRHVFLCYKTPGEWEPRVEVSDSHSLLKIFFSALKARKNDIALKTKTTVCEAREGTGFEDGDVLIFPDMIKYKGLKDSDVEGFVDDVLVNGKPWTNGSKEDLTGSHVFVCAHASRDKRCGVCGPVLMEKLNEGIVSRGLKDQVFVIGCSHIGGHKYAGNVIVYSPDAGGKITGHWYGYATPDDVAEILDDHIGKGTVIGRLLRGQMGGPTEQAEKVAEPKYPNGKDAQHSEAHEETKTEITKDTSTGCCQGANGFSCCRTENAEPITEKKPENNETSGKKALGKLSNWIRSLEQSDVLTIAAIVGAVATVAVACSLYRRSS